MVLKKSNIKKNQNNKLPIIDPKMIKNLKDYVFIPNKDSDDNNLGYFPNKTVDELDNICKMFDDAIGFNTYGYIKNKINIQYIDLTPLQYQNDGLFINIHKYSYYNKNITDKIKMGNIKNNLILIMSIYGNYESFEKTFNSFINCCKDSMLIECFLCICDNDDFTKEDKIRISNNYPFIELIFKNYNEKYMEIIMNIDNIFNFEYLLYLDDKILFFDKNDYITKGINFFKHDNNQNIDQILFNVIHEEKNNDKILIPSIIKTELLKTISECNIKSLYIYDKLLCYYSDNLILKKSIKNKYKFMTYCINLERRKDRKEIMINKFKDNKLYEYQFYKAIDGKLLESSEYIYKLFLNNDFNYTKSVIGAALSHYNIWKLLVDSDYDFFIVYEDDIDFTDNYKYKLNYILNKINFDVCDYTLLGYIMFSHLHKKYKHIYDDSNEENIKISKLNRELYIGSAFSYIITKKGATKILDYFKENGIKYGIDYAISKVPTLNMFETQPHLIFTKWVEDSLSEVDSDIHRNKDYFIFTNT